MQVKTQVVEIDPDLLLVKFKGLKPPERAAWLHRTLTDWLAAHPGKKVRKTQPIQNSGLVAVLVWLGEPNVSMKVHHRLSQVPREHLEALCQHAYEIYFKHPEAAKLIIANHSGQAVVIDRDSAYVLPFDELDLGENAREDFAVWQTRGETNYFVLHSDQ